MTRVDLDALAGTAITARTTVRDVEAGRFVAWTQDDEALPMPGKSDTARVDFPLGDQPLRVTRLATPRYRLTIDGDAIGVFTREDLEQGIDLALCETPMTRQAQRVLDLVQQRAAVAREIWNQLQPAPANRAVLNELISRHRELAIKLAELQKPRTHDYELQPVDGSSDQ